MGDVDIGVGFAVFQYMCCGGLWTLNVAASIAWGIAEVGLAMVLSIPSRFYTGQRRARLYVMLVSD